VFDAQRSTGLDGEFWLVATGAGAQLLLTGPGLEFLDRVEWEQGAATATAYKPDSDRNSPVRLAPDTRFGLPSIRGVSTETVWEQVEVGEDAESVADALGLELADVRWALAYENAQRAA
jgi:uncharacterized protein (DUF433 family)